MSGLIPHEDSIRVSMLDNGLTVIIQALDYSPVAATTIGYRVGSIDEGPGTRGLSHFCEHMMFKGTPAFGPGRYWSVVQRNGGNANAFTSRDMTVYYSMAPVAGLREVLELEADRMTGCLMDPSEVIPERQVVLEEELLTGRDSAGGALDDALFRTAFRVHPYGYPVIGTSEDIMSITPGSAGDFYRRFYRPSNAVLSIVGKVDPEETLGMVTDLFGSLSSGISDRTAPDPEPPQTKARRVEIDHPSPLPRCSLAFHVPGAGHPDSRALSLLAIHLSAGRSSRFEELLVSPGIVLDVSASTNTLRDPGLFTIHTALSSIDHRERMLAILEEEIGSIASGGLSEETLAIVKRRRMAWSRISDTDPSGRSRRFVVGELKHGDPLFYWRSSVEADGVGNGDLMRTVAEYMRPERSVLAILRPESSGTAPGKASGQRDEESDDLAPPSILVPSETSVPDRLLRQPEWSLSRDTEDVRLDNGLRLLLKNDTSFPVVSIAFSFPMGTRTEPSTLAGLSGVVTETMLYGTVEEDSIRFNRRVENLGSGIELSPVNEFSGGGMTVLGGDLREALSAIADLLMKPALRKEDLETVLRESTAELKDWYSSPIGAAMDSFARLSTDPPESASVPTVESLAAIRREDVTSHFSNCCRPEGTVISIVGDFSGGDPRMIAEDLFGHWTGGNAPPAEVEVRHNASRSCSETLKIRGREQVAVVMGAQAPSRHHEDTYAFTLLNGILGEGIGSRLGRSIRDSAGLSYHVSSVYLPFSDRGRLATLLMTSPGACRRAMVMLKESVDSLYNGPIGIDELRLELASHLGNLQMTSTRYSSIARALMTFASMELPLDFDSLSTSRLLSLTQDDIRDVARKWLGDGIRYTSVAGSVPDGLDDIL